MLPKVYRYCVFCVGITRPEYVGNVPGGRNCESPPCAVFFWDLPMALGLAAGADPQA